jgi:heat shock protein HslJ
MRRALAGCTTGLALVAVLAGCHLSKPGATMQETTWLTEQIDGNGVAPRVQSTLRVDSDGRASGNAGCNRFTGTASITGDEVRFGPFAATRRMCPPAVMDQEGRYLAALEATRRFELKDGALRLRDEDGGELVLFIVTEAPE